MKLNEELIQATAATLVTTFGFTPVGFWYVGSETHFYIFNAPDGLG